MYPVKKPCRYFFPLPIKKSISAIIPTTTRIPTHTPALKIPPITSQPEKTVRINNKSE
jgi:hypothetical protein